MPDSAESDPDLDLGLFGPDGPTRESVEQAEAQFRQQWSVTLPKPAHRVNDVVAVAYRSGDPAPVARAVEATLLDSSAERVRQLDRAVHEGRLERRAT